jgi:hypothetical protein
MQRENRDHGKKVQGSEGDWIAILGSTNITVLLTSWTGGLTVYANLSPFRFHRTYFNAVG